ncbi:hypothetical protein OJF2_29020 [Aquisphaera giovannonii]|uniref:Uncharacterized protein n=1 Tax=Aquisphaera giovannonii TaxID=406548 RepID=A0A5B9W2T0_9BACT|nr:hypothetical protein [Aquisphaera giovannonii]QEH34365.1 hypothetical protein OJF2_29020 [Aquisphaera giovannonii]
MPTSISIEERLAAVEAAVQDIRRRIRDDSTSLHDEARVETTAHVEKTPAAAHWIDRFTGAFEDEPAFAQVVAYGRAFRESDRPGEDDPE